jgi:VWFA-related protein
MGKWQSFRLYAARRGIHWALTAFVMAGVLTGFASSQDAPPPSQDDSGIPTLHVYTNLLQIPTLVLDSQHRPIRAIPERRFLVSIDSGPKSHVAHVRVEGEDPIALAILVDATRLQSNVTSKLRDAIVGLSPNSLHPGDSVSLYNLTCQLSRAVAASPISVDSLRESAELMFGEPKGSGRENSSKPCKQPQWNLLDAIVSAAKGLKDEPGRRVLLVLTDGQDRGSRTTWDEARVFATAKGAAIFGIVFSTDMTMPIRGPRGIMGTQAVSTAMNMVQLSESTGGMVLDNTDSGLATEFRDFVALVRGRYIVEFPRPDTGAGSHSLDISVEKMSGAFIRPAGASVPVADPELAKDPNTILPDPSNAPAVGTKRPKQ